jgi:intein/homing endonuclease
MKLGVIKGRVKPPIDPHRIPPSSRNLTSEKAYILGVLGPGDGWLDFSRKKRRYLIGLETVDEEFADKFRECLYKTYGVMPSKKKKIKRYPKWTDKYVVRLCCKAACEDLLSYSISFKKNDWSIPTAIKNASLAIQAGHLKAFFDSEGNVDADGRRIKGTSTCLSGLQEISALLANFGINFRILRQSKKENRKNVYDIRIQGRKSIELFGKHIGFTVIRRKEKLQRLLTNYKLRMTPRDEVTKLEPEMLRLRNLDLTYDEIAKRLNLSIGTVWRHLNK